VGSTPVLDARVRRTRSRLRDALVSLIHEKAYHAIIVNEILERAEVGRSAFYSHFCNKDALLATGIDQVLHGTPPRQLPPTVGPFGRILWFSFPVFEYIGQHRHAAGAKMSRRSRAVVHQHLRKRLVDEIRDDVKAVLQHVQQSGTKIPADLLADHIVATFIRTLDWWVDSGSPLSPRQADDVFLSLVVPTVAQPVTADLGADVME
jgi:AcrR family transcriptional regulator